MKVKTISVLLACGAIAVTAELLLLRRYAAKHIRTPEHIDLSLGPPRSVGASNIDVPALHQLIRSGDRLVVTDGVEDTMLFQSQDPEDLRSFSDALAIASPDHSFHDMCDGSPAIHIQKAGREILLITQHHGHAIRASIWSSDVRLSEPEKLLRWFDSHGIPGPREEVEAEHVRAQAQLKAQVRWLLAVPVPLREFQEEFLAVASSGAPEPPPVDLKRALSRAAPVTVLQIRTLFNWFGSGMGPWSGFPAYEQVPEHVLLTYTTAELVAVAQQQDLTAVELEGAARPFGGWEFGRMRPNDLEALPSNLKSKLLKHSLQSSDEDKRGRAQHAFGPGPKSTGAA